MTNLVSTKNTGPASSGINVEEKIKELLYVYSEREIMLMDNENKIFAQMHNSRVNMVLSVVSTHVQQAVDTARAELIRELIKSGIKSKGGPVDLEEVGHEVYHRYNSLQPTKENMPKGEKE
jgi:hypothetical protein